MKKYEKALLAIFGCCAVLWSIRARFCPLTNCWNAFGIVTVTLSTIIRYPFISAVSERKLRIPHPTPAVL